MSRLRRGFATLALLTAVAGCAVPQSKERDDLAKPATTLAAAEQVLIRYNLVREQVDRAADPSALRDIEGGHLLEIDQGLLFLRRELGLSAAPLRLDTSGDILAGSFDQYPLWFAAFTRLVGEKERVAAVFTRATSTSRWSMTEAPRLAGSTTVPGVATDSEGLAVTYDVAGAQWSDGEPTGLRATPQQLVDRYARLLQQPRSRWRDDFVKDSFLVQMRELRAEQPSVDVQFSQTWKAEQVEHVVKLSDGGALVFATLVRTDRYQVQPGHSIDFTGLEASAYFSDPLKSEATLRYTHQVLLMVPGRGRPLVIGQHGGLVDATGS